MGRLLRRRPTSRSEVKGLRPGRRHTIKRIQDVK